MRIEDVEVERTTTNTTVRFVATVTAGRASECAAFVDGQPVPTVLEGTRIVGSWSTHANAYNHRHSEWRPAYGPLVTLAVRSSSGAVAGALGTSKHASL
ncbi:hypothetical protein ACW0JT_17930 [Arthrobacter sp. SA17]